MREWYGRYVILILLLSACSCAPDNSGQNASGPPTPRLEGIARERRQVQFLAQDAVLAGELDLPRGDGPAPLVFVIHHSGPVTRDAYGYLAELLLKEGYAVFRFDKRGTGMSSGTYGCCEGSDAVAAYRAATAQEGLDLNSVFIVAQSVGTSHLGRMYEQVADIQQPRGVVLLSNLLDSRDIVAIAAPAHIIISDSEEDIQELGQNAAQAHQDAYASGTSYYIADQTEHTLFDISSGPIDWDDPEWTQRYHRGAMKSLIDWLNEGRIASREGSGGTQAHDKEK